MDIYLERDNRPQQTEAADIRTLLDHLENEYVGAEIAAVMRRLRAIVGYTETRGDRG